MSADSLVPSADNPPALNRYSYGFNTPLKYTDPSGHWPEILDQILAFFYNSATGNNPSNDPTEMALAHPETIQGQAVAMYADVLDKHVIPEAIGVRVEFSVPIGQSGISAGASGEAVHFRRSGESSVFIAPSIALNLGKTATLDGGIVAAANVPSADSWRGGFLNYQVQTNAPLPTGITAGAFETSPRVKKGPAGVYVGLTTPDGGPAFTFGYSYSFEVYNSKKGFLPNPPSAAKVAQDVYNSAKDTCGYHCQAKE